MEFEVALGKGDAPDGRGVGAVGTVGTVRMKRTIGTGGRSGLGGKEERRPTR